jgi:hypothetical protein
MLYLLNTTLKKLVPVVHTASGTCWQVEELNANMASASGICWQVAELNAEMSSASGICWQVEELNAEMAHAVESLRKNHWMLFSKVRSFDSANVI